MKILSKHDLVDGFNAIKIDGIKHEITQSFNYCTGKANQDLEQQATAEEDLIIKASQHCADANAIIITVTRDQGKIVTGRPVYIPALDQCEQAMA